MEERDLLVDFHDRRAYLDTVPDSDLRREHLERTLDAYLGTLVQDPPSARDEPAQARLMRCLHVHAKRSAEFEQQAERLRATVKHLEERLEEAAGRPDRANIQDMSSAHDPESAHRRPHPAAMAASYLEFDLEREIDHLRREPAWDKGQNAKTLVKHDDLRIVVMALRAGATLSRHQTAGRVSIQAIAGHVRIRAEGRTFDLRAGSLLVLDRMLAHDVEAFEDSAMLLTISFAERDSDKGV